MKQLVVSPPDHGREVLFQTNNMRPDVPGLLCPHGCSYMACRGLALSPVKDAFVITHGPVGCGYFAWGGLRSTDEDIGIAYQGYFFSTSLEEDDIVFGGEKKLEKAIDEAVELFHPPVILVCSTCPAGLIGDDLDAVAKAAAMRHGIQVIPVACEGFKNVPGFRLSNYNMIDRIMGTADKDIAPFAVNMVGEYYTGETGKEIEEILNRAGIEVVSSLMGDGSIEEIRYGHLAGLNVFMSGKPVQDIVRYAADKFKTGWIAANFFGIKNLVDSFIGIAAFFKDEELLKKMKTEMQKRKREAELALEPYKKEFGGLCAVLSEDGFQTDCFCAVLEDLGVQCAVVRGEDGATLYSAIQNEDYEVFVPEACAGRVDGAPAERTEAPGGFVLKLHGKENASALLNKFAPDLCFWNLKDEFNMTGGIRPLGFETDEHYVHFGGFCGTVDFARQLMRGVAMARWRENMLQEQRRLEG